MTNDFRFTTTFKFHTRKPIKETRIKVEICQAVESHASGKRRITSLPDVKLLFAVSTIME